MNLNKKDRPKVGIHMIIRPMTEDDIKILVEMGELAHKESDYNIMSYDGTKCSL